jgi:hypothetical protein
MKSFKETLVGEKFRLAALFVASCREQSEEFSSLAERREIASLFNNGDEASECLRKEKTFTRHSFTAKRKSTENTKNC